jgi:hypothetical protein
MDRLSFNKWKSKKLTRRATFVPPGSGPRNPGGSCENRVMGTGDPEPGEVISINGTSYRLGGDELPMESVTADVCIVAQLTLRIGCAIMRHRRSARG